MLRYCPCLEYSEPGPSFHIDARQFRTTARRDASSSACRAKQSYAPDQTGHE